MNELGKKSFRWLTGRPGPRLAAIFFSLLFLACTQEVQRNEKPLLASNWGGTAGGPIAGRLEVQVFDDTFHFPVAGAVVSLGGSGATTLLTDPEGIAVFEGVHGPQEVHVFACSCGDNVQSPYAYQAVSFYQVNAAYLTVPLSTREPAIAEGSVEGKVFDVEEDQKAYLAVIDEIGKFKLSAPLGSTTYHLLNDESPASSDLTFVFARNLDAWAAVDSGKQPFGAVALLGTAIGPSKEAQGGVRVEARYFNGNPTERPYYFNEEGTIDPSLQTTSANGRFVFLRLTPNNDLLISAASLGTGIGARFVHLPAKGTVVFSLPVLPLTDASVDLSGRIVAYRPDFREEEKKGPFAGENLGIEGAVISLSGDRLDQLYIADRGPGVDGNYRIERHLLPNSRYVAAVLSGRGFRPTYQEIVTNSRSKFNYPLTAIPLDVLGAIVRDAKIKDTPDDNGNPRNRVGLLAGHGEIAGRFVEATGQFDANGDPLVQPIAGVVLTVTDEAGEPAQKTDPDGKKVNNVFYLNPDGSFTPSVANVDGTATPNLSSTSPGGGFVIVDLPAQTGSALYTLIALDAVTKEVLARRTLTVYSDRTRLVELEKQGSAARPAPRVSGPQGDPIGGVALKLIGEKLDCPAGCASNSAGGAAVTLPDKGEFLVGMEKSSGGGDYKVGVQGSKRRFGLSAFRVSPGGDLDNVTFSGGLGPLSPGKRLLFDIGFLPAPEFLATTGKLILPPSFVENDFRVVLSGALGAQGKAFVGIDPGFSVSADGRPYRMVSRLAPAPLSYFILGFVQNLRGESSRVMVQGLPVLPPVQDLPFGSPPRFLTPNGVSGVGTTARLIWSAPEGETIDFYRVAFETPSGESLWEAWVPGALNEIIVPAMPAAVPGLAKPFAAGTKVKWTVRAIRADGLTLDRFNFQELGDRLIGDAVAVSEFVQ